MELDTLLKPKRVQEILGVSHTTIWKLQKQGLLKPDYVTKGGHRRYKMATLLNFLELPKTYEDVRKLYHTFRGNSRIAKVSYPLPNDLAKQLLQLLAKHLVISRENGELMQIASVTFPTAEGEIGTVNLISSARTLDS